MKPPLSSRPPTGMTSAFVGQMRRFLSSRSGSIAAEFALIVPLLLVLIFGVIEFGRVMWVRNSLQSAVEDAARCYALNRPACDTGAKVKAYAAAAAMGVPVDASNFTLPADTCGKKVEGVYVFSSVVPIIPLSVTLGVNACRAAPPS